MSTSYPKQSRKKKKDDGLPTSDFLGVPTTSVTPSPSSSVSNLHGDKPKKGFRASIRSLFSSGKEKEQQKPQEPTIVAGSTEAPKEDDSQKKVENSSQNELQSKRIDADLTEDPNSQWQLKAIDYSMEVMSLFEELSGLVALVVPDALGMALRTITAILQKLKQMIENNQAWKDLLMSIDDRQRVFNEQLGGVQPHELPPKLMSAMKQYAQALEKLAARVMEQAGLAVKGAPEDGRIAKIKAFMNRAYNAESDAGAIEGYKVELNVAINEVQTSLTIYTAVTVNRIDKKADNLKALIFLEGSSAAEKTPLGTKHKRCLENTRVDVLEDIRRWKQAESIEENPVYCIGDVAGTGKSTIAYTMAEEWSKEQCFSFFFSTTSTHTPQALCISLAKQIIGSCYGVDWDDYWATLSSELSSPVSQTADNLWEKLVAQPLAKCVDHQSHFIVVDALDECDLENRAAILKCMLDTCSSKSEPRLRLLLTTRKEDDISNTFDQDTYHDLISHKSLLDSTTAQADIARYVEDRMSKWAGAQLTDEQRDHLIDRCGGLFIFASLACSLLEGELPKNRPRRLQAVLGDFTSLDSLYHQTLLQADGSSEYTRELLKNILGVILVAQEPLSISALAALLLEPNEDVRMLVKRLGSILGSGADDQPIQILHATLKEFLLRETWTEKNKDPSTGRERTEKIQNDYQIQGPESHLTIVKGCLSIMEKELTFNICHLETSFLLNEQVEDMEDRIRRWISDGLHYSCLHWTSHLKSARFETDIVCRLQDFTSTHFLTWLEVLSVTKRVGFASRMMDVLTKWIQIYRPNDEMVKEMGKFVATFTSAIALSAPHIYLSALPFSPRSSSLSKRYLKLYPQTLKVPTGGFSSWPSAQNVFFGHTYGVNSVGFSPDGLQIISGSYDETIRVWNAETGEAFGRSFNSTNSPVNSVIFSPDGKRIAAGLEDGTIWIWEAETSEAIRRPYGGHDKRVTSIAFSPSGKFLASGSDDKTIRIWDTETGKAVGSPLKGHDDLVTSVAVSFDGKHIASGSDDKTIRIWDLETGEAVGEPFEGHGESVNSVAFSPDGKRIVSGSYDRTIRLWDAETRNMITAPLRGHDYSVRSVAFSPDGKYIVSASDDKTVRLWDAKTGEAVGVPFEGHDQPVTCIAFSPDGKRITSGSRDQTIRVWAIGTEGSARASFEGHDDSIMSVAFSHDGKYAASGSNDLTIRIWDVETGDPVGVPFEGHEGWVTSVKFSPDDKLIVSGSRDKTIRVWDIETGKAVGAPFTGHDDCIGCIVLSHDGRLVFSGSEDKTIRVWDVKTGEVIRAPFEGHDDWVTCLALSPDGKRIVSGSDDYKVRVWDVESGESAGAPLEGHEGWVRSVAFSPDGKSIISGSRDQTIRLWDAETGRALGVPLKGHDDCVNSIALSSDGKRIVSGSRDSTIRLWDFETREAIGAPVKGHDDCVQSIAFSPDGKRIISGSDDKTIRLWDPEAIETPSLVSSATIENGWMVSSGSEKLFWVPPHLRAGLPGGGATVIIGRFLKTKLDLTSFVYGNSWALCKG